MAERLRPPTNTSPSIRVDMFAYGDGERFRLRLHRDPARSDVSIFVEASTSLTGPWTVLASSLLGAPYSGPGYVGGDEDSPGVKDVEIRDVIPATQEPVRYVQVRVSR